MPPRKPTTSINYATYVRGTAPDGASSLPVAALGDDLAAPALGIFLLGQDLLAPLEGVGRGAQLDAHGGADQLEDLAERVLEVALVGVLHVVQAAAVDHDDGGVHPALVRIAHLGTEAPRPRGLLLFDRDLQRARELGRGELGHG